MSCTHECNQGRTCTCREAPSQKHKPNCASLTMMLTSLPPKPAPCDCAAPSWNHDRNPEIDMNEAADRIEALEKTLRQAREALDKHGAHAEDCRHPAWECDCGYDKSIAAIDAVLNNTTTTKE